MRYGHSARAPTLAKMSQAFRSLVLEKARAINNRQRARLLLVHAHNYLKCAEETEAQQLSAGRADRDTLHAGYL
jgi:hypothetical protein